MCAVLCRKWYVCTCVYVRKRYVCGVPTSQIWWCDTKYDDVTLCMMMWHIIMYVCVRVSNAHGCFYNILRWTYPCKHYLTQWWKSMYTNTFNNDDKTCHISIYKNANDGMGCFFGTQLGCFFWNFGTLSSGVCADDDVTLCMMMWQIIAHKCMRVFLTNTGFRSICGGNARGAPLGGRSAIWTFRFSETYHNKWWWQIS
jgi:hypothetical protein